MPIRAFGGRVRIDVCSIAGAENCDSGIGRLERPHEKGILAFVYESWLSNGFVLQVQFFGECQCVAPIEC